MQRHNNLRSQPGLIILQPPTDLLRMAHHCLAGGQRGKLIQTSILKSINQCIWPKTHFQNRIIAGLYLKGCFSNSIRNGLYSGRAAILVLNRILQKEIWIVAGHKYIYNSICTGGIL